MNARVALSLMLAAACASGSAAALGQSRDFPSRPVRMIVPFPPGGSVDLVARILHHKLTEVMGQTIVVDNRPGASGNIGTELAARAVADGHTIVITTLPLVVNLSLFANPHYAMRSARRTWPGALPRKAPRSSRVLRRSSPSTCAPPSSSGRGWSRKADSRSFSLPVTVR